MFEGNMTRVAAKKKKSGGAETLTISLRLLRNDRTIDDAVRTTAKLKEQSASDGRLFYSQSNDNTPSWLGLVNQFARTPLKLANKSCAAVLFINVIDEDGKTRTFALAFGSGHLALHADAFERNFGLKVALNSIARANLKNLDMATLEATSFQKRVQASRTSDLGGFGLDTEHDLLRLVGGVPTDTTFASSVSGKDALTLTAKLSPSKIATKCADALKLFVATDYKNDYGFIDQISPVRKTDLIQLLDSLVFAEIQNLLMSKSSDLHLTIPNIIDPEETHEIGYFGTGFKSGGKQSYADLTIEDYIAEIRTGRPTELIDIGSIKAGQEIQIIKNGQGDKKKRQRLYDCFVYEANHDKNTYVLFAGEWYLIEDQFFKSVEADFIKLVSSTPFITKTKCVTERELIENLDKNPDLLNLDQVKASPAGAAGANLEPCDFFSRKKEFIHLKDGHGSAPISHLWNQGVVAAESFVRDEKFRKAVRDNAIKRQKSAKKAGFESLLPDGRSKPTPSDYKVIYGIMRHPYKASNKLGLPFFSKVSLRAAANRLALMGYAVEVHLIEKQ
jgi:uncharacterized protein (TIGR04141 family)